MRKQIAIAGASIVGLVAASYLFLGYWRAAVVVAVPTRGPAVEAV